MTTFTSPLRHGDKESDSIGEVVVAQAAKKLYSATGTTTLFNVPAYTRVIYVHIDVETAFNAATTNTIKVDMGTQSLTDNVDVSSTGRASVTIQVNNLAAGNKPLEVKATYTQSGTAATAGEANVIVGYTVNRVLPT